MRNSPLTMRFCARAVVLQGTSGRKVGELRGHTSSVTHIAHDSNHNHIFTMSLDKSIKVDAFC